MKKFTFSLFVSATAIYASSLVVYNSNIGLVHEERPLQLQKNDNSIIYKDVASSIITESINLKLPKGVQLYSQQYRYDKLNLNKLLEYNVGKKVKIKDKTYTLLWSNATQSILRDENNSIVTKKSQELVFDKIPTQLLSKPSLIFNIKTDRDIHSKIAFDYLIKNIKWSANYVLDVTKNRANLTGYISITNNSGKSFKDTTLYTLAGNVNRVSQPHPRIMYSKVMAADSMSVSQHNIEGYHLYKIPFKVNLTNKEKTQINFLNKQNLKIKRSYEVYMSNPLYFYGEQTHNVTQFILLQKIATPLPSGTIRAYSKYNSTSIFLGENKIKHTPKNEKVRVKLGTNFDIKAKETLIKRADRKNYFDVDVRYTLENSSSENKIILLKIPFTRKQSAKIESKRAYRFTKGNLATFSIKVKAESNTSFNIHFESKK
ncbi:DUF4139 domain-containing protein [Sulfurimonas sp.]